MKKAIFISVAAHIALLLAFIFFRLPADTPAGDAGMVVMVVVDIEGVDEYIHSDDVSRGGAPSPPSKVVGAHSPKNWRTGNGSPLPDEDLSKVCHSCEGRNPEHLNAGVPSAAADGDDMPSGNSEPRTQNSEPGTSAGNPILSKIRSKIERSKYYPPEAQRQKLEGKPKVTFQIKEDGGIAYISLLESSGSAILDNAALETVRRSAPLPYYSEPIILSIKFSSKSK